MGSPVGYCPATSSHGGIITGPITNTFADGRPICVQGAIHICPMKKHGASQIQVTGFTMCDGKRVEVLGDRCNCGASIIEVSGSTFSE